MIKDEIAKSNVNDTDLLISYYYQLKPNGHWFDKDTMRFFKTRLLHSHIKTVKQVVYFIASNRYDMDTPRTYKVQAFNLVTADMSSQSPLAGETISEAKARYNKTT